MLIEEKLKADLQQDAVGDIRAAITTLAWTNGITAQADPIDTFVNAASHLCDADVDLDHYERLLVALGRKGVLTDDEGFAMHAAYLAQTAHGV